jgi:hypothetical protein
MESQQLLLSLHLFCNSFCKCPVLLRLITHRCTLIVVLTYIVLLVMLGFYYNRSWEKYLLFCDATLSSLLNSIHRKVQNQHYSFYTAPTKRTINRNNHSMSASIVDQVLLFSNRFSTVDRIYCPFLWMSDLPQPQPYTNIILLVD